MSKSTVSTFELWDRVFDKADPRHVGIVRQINYANSGATARVMWEETGWFSCRVPLADLRRAPREPGIRGGRRRLLLCGPIRRIKDWQHNSRQHGS